MNRAAQRPSAHPRPSQTHSSRLCEGLTSCGSFPSVASCQRAFGDFEVTFGARHCVANFTDELVSQGRVSRSDAEEALRRYHTCPFAHIAPYDDAVTVFKELRRRGLKLAVVTAGDERRQLRKLDVLGLRALVDAVHVGLDGRQPEQTLLDAAASLHVRIEDCAVVGDRIFAEISSARRLGAGW